MCFNETVSVPWAVWKWLEFYKHESCGKCTPCREGTGWLVQILRRVVSGTGTMEDLDTMADAAGNIAGPVVLRPRRRRSHADPVQLQVLPR